VKNAIFFVTLLAISLFAETHPLQVLIQTARENPAKLKELLPANIHDLKERGGVAVWGQDFLFAVDTDKTPSISVNHEPPAPMTRVPESNFWFTLRKLRIGVTHRFEFYAEGKPMGRLYSYDAAGYNPDSYPQPGVPRGTMSARKTIQSRAYPDSNTDFWVYASPGVNPSTEAALMVWQDGRGIVGAQDLVRLRLAIVTENLVHQKVIPPMVHVLISPGTGQNMRGIQYGTHSDRYVRYVLDEILPEVQKTYRLRPDAYSRGIGGLSAGGVCAFNAAWFAPDQFSRVLSHVGAFTAPQSSPAENREGGHLYPFKVRREPRKNLRVWLSGVSDDMESAGGSFSLQNIQLANSLKLSGYDFHFRFSDTAMHSVGQAALDLPEALAWLWRDYDPSKRAQTYEMEPAEREKPLYRVRISNREAW
jgi:enterochelin esterase family protein